MLCTKGGSVRAITTKDISFILRVKEEVLKDLPPITNIIYHCGLSKYQELESLMPKMQKKN